MISMKKDNKGRNLKQNEDQLKDGRYRYRYTNKYGERKAIYAWKLTTTDKTPVGKREDLCLREKIKKLEKDLIEEIDINLSKMTVNQLFERYIETKPQLAIATKQNYIHMWEHNIKNNRFGMMKICDVRKSDVLTLYSYFYQERNFKITTIQLYQNILYPAFQMAVDDMIIRINPCRNCMKNYVRGSLSSAKYPLTVEEQRVLLHFVKHNDIYQNSYPLIAFMLGTGCRIGEVIGLTWNDINFERKCVSINHQIIYKKKDGKVQYYVSPPKNGESRIIPLQDNIINIMNEYKRNTIFISKSSGFKVDGYKDFVFINNVGKIRTPNTIVRTFHSIRDLYNRNESENAIEERRKPILLPDFSPHILRHTFCTRMAENGIDIKVLQEIMGHKNINVTMQVYNHVNFERTQKAVNETKEVLDISV